MRGHACHILLSLTICGVLLAGGLAIARAQTLQLPTHPAPETKPKAPLPAPLTPVHKAAPNHATPVVTPRKGTPRHKPSAARAAASAKHAAHPAPAKPEAKPVPVPAVAPVPPPAKPAAPAESEKGASTGLPLPRFAALRTDEVNLRTGPGTRYPIEWVYKRRYLPVEIEREFDVWRLVAMPDGTRGWVHQATLTGRRDLVVEPAEATLRAQPREDAAAVALLKPGVVGRIRTCAAGAAWCRVQVGEYAGFLPRSAFWGTLPGEAVGP